MITEFKHNQTAHCENGAATNLLGHYGVEISEPLAFGIGSGLFFVYMPFIKHNQIPVSSFRPMPGVIFNRLTKTLGIKTYRKKFRDKEESMKALDQALSENIPVGLQVGVFHLPYFPRPYRFHFNSHNIVVYGRENGRYLISDSVMEDTESLSYEELMRVRWAPGSFAPRGHMYYPLKIPAQIDMPSAIVKGIRRNCREMLSIPLPFFGIKGIRYVSRRIKKWPAKLGEKKAALHLGNFIRMQEEIGTGGAGFRFIYAAFLEEASNILNKPRLMELSQTMTENGDQWRQLATIAARIIKERNNDLETYLAISAILEEIADREQYIFSELKKAVS
ncbi:MAG: BtrH N-terminal domain-containing protein [Desulfobacterales bacterium]